MEELKIPDYEEEDEAAIHPGTMSTKAEHPPKKPIPPAAVTTEVIPSHP
jgi:hypothetical protein